MKILTLNLWRYYEWDKRKNQAISFFKEQNADIIFLQEVARDERLKRTWKNQVEELNKNLSYPFRAYEDLCKMEKWHKKPINWDMYYGLGILSKYPIISSKIIILPQILKKKNFGFLYVQIETPKGKIDLINVHLENTNEGSKKHLKYILNWCKQRNINPIIAGDFNMYLIDTLKELAEKDYHISYEIKKYFSFMPTKFSNNTSPITLDYILASQNKFIMDKVDCINNDVSDHNAIVAEIKIN